MPQCIKLKKKKQQYCIGDMRDEIVIQNRAITAPQTGVDFSETFTNTITVLSAINTVSGKTYFDDVGTETNITHTIGLRFVEGVTAESWVLFDERRLDVLTVDNLDERGQWMRLQCVDRGESAKAASEI